MGSWIFNFLSLISVSVVMQRCMSQMSSKNAISSFNPGGQYVVLTFDDGPHAILTPKLLDILKEKKAKATFFVIGLKARMHPDILKRIVEEGHELANHTWNHPILSKLQVEDVHAQMEKTNQAIFEATNKKPEVMRPPYGNTNGKLNEYLTNNEKLKVIMWSIDTNDWRRPAPQAIVDKVTKSVKPGSVILCHDIHPGTIEAMPMLIDKLTEKGYQFVTVTEILSFPDDSPHRYLRGAA